MLNERRFEVRVSEMGLSLDDAATIAEAIADQYGKGDEAGDIGDIISLFPKEFQYRAHSGGFQVKASLVRLNNRQHSSLPHHCTGSNLPFSKDTILH